MMALTRPAGLRQFRVRLPREPAAADGARGHDRAVVAGWKIPVDPDIAVLVTALSTAWGCFHTPAGQAVYVTLAFQSALPA
jgi:CubicO group peptidase (beta-lactamase class C family)